MDPQTQNQIFALMTVAEEHQKAAAAAIEGLAKERAALARERVALVQAAAQIAGQAGAVTQAAVNAAPTLQNAAGAAVSEALRVGLLNLSETATDALDEASKPLLGRMSMATKAASEASETLADSLGGFRQRLGRVVVGLSAGAVAVVGLSAWGMVAWQRHQVDSLREERDALTADVQELRAKVAALEKKGGRIAMAICGGRLCIEASSNQGENDKGQPLPPLQGTWRTTDGRNVALVIPRGY